MTTGDPATDRALQRGLAKAIARSWKDDSYRDRLLADPRAALAELGVDVPAGTVIRVVPDDLVELPLPGPDAEWDEESAAAALGRLLSPES
ncbi:MAG: NHLP leader peptide family natural product precursor [Actinobacteria bacterium]|jgi:hypothetical protein|nr:NHLP leader peptide family natural product precursor [Actinomycetota bacterium]